MQCPGCGSGLEPGGAFCPSCGADVRGVAVPAPPPPEPVPLPEPVPMPEPAPTPLPVPAPRPQGTPPSFPTGQQQPPYGYGGQQPPFPGAQQPPPYGYGAQPGFAAASVPPAPRRGGLSTGAIIGIVCGAIALVLLMGVGGFFAFKSLTGSKQPGVPPTTTSAQSNSASVASSTASANEETSPGEPGATTTAGGSATTAPSTTSAAKDDIVTDAEARAIVKKFWDYRIAGNLAASVALCSKNMRTGDNGSFVNDKYWHPDSYKIIKTTPDLMYIHVAIMGQWPSGDEPVILSVWRDPESGKVVIDGMLDPQYSPELVKP